MQNLRLHRLPYTANGVVILDAQGGQVAIVSTATHAAFICRACNRYHRMLAIFDLCRGRHDNLTQPYTYAHDKAFDVLKKEMDDDLTANGR